MRFSIVDILSIKGAKYLPIFFAFISSNSSLSGCNLLVSLINFLIFSSISLFSSWIFLISAKISLGVFVLIVLNDGVCDDFVFNDLNDVDFDDGVFDFDFDIDNDFDIH